MVVTHRTGDRLNRMEGAIARLRTVLERLRAYPLEE